MLSDGYIRVHYPILCSFVYFEVSSNRGLIETGTMGVQWPGKGH